MEAYLLDAIKHFANQSNSFYIYDERGIQEAVARLKADFSDAMFLYSVKCNPHPAILSMLADADLGADAASLNEVLRAREAGMPAECIYYSTPGKTDEDIAGALEQAHLIADSLGELSRIEKEAARRNLKVAVGLRIHPSIGFDGTPSDASKYGIDEDAAMKLLAAWPHPHLEVRGIHVHLLSQVLDADAIAAYHTRVFELAERVAAAGVMLDYVNFGSGMGISGMDEPALNQKTVAAIFAENAR